MISIPIEFSARHVHLTAQDWQTLFETSEPTIQRTISQPTQYVATERLTLAGPKGQFENIAMVGPIREYTQVELSMSDARVLGITPPLSDSGNLQHAAEITLIGPAGQLTRSAAILQQRHIHASVVEAEQYGLHDRQIVSVIVDGTRGGRFDNVLVRVHARYVWSMHVDTDEANAFGITAGTSGQVVVEPS